MTFVQKWMRLVKAATLTAFVAGGLAACGGGGGNAGTPVTGGGSGGSGTVTVSDVSAVLSKSTMANDGSETLTLTVAALDANRGGVSGATLTVAVSDPNNSVFLGASTLTTDSTGQATTTVALGSNQTLRAVTINVTSGSITRSATFNVVQSTTPTTVATDLTIGLDKYSITNAGSDVVTATVTAVDANRNVLSNVPVSFSVNNNGTIAVSNSLTNTSGQAIATARIGSDKSNRLITITATSGTLTRTASFQVTGAKLVASAVPGTPTAGSTGNTVQYRLSDVNDNAIANQSISVTAPGLVAAAGTTDTSGAYTFTYVAPTTAGPIDISAVAGGLTTVTTVTVPSSTSTIPTVTTTVASASVAANPTVVGVNTSGSSTNRTEIRALFLAANNAPITNIRVRFDMNGDSNSIGGAINSGTSLVYSDSSGVATTSYIPSTRSSPTNGVTIRACWGYSDFAVGTCPNTATATLTVVSDPLSITIGTDNSITDGSTNLTYVKRFVLLVVDAAGNPKADVQITPTIDLNYYLKGVYQVNGSSWAPYVYLDNVLQSGVGTCRNEDDNRNGAIDTGEDRNGNSQLDPRKSDISIAVDTSVSTDKTDASGQVVLKIEYAKNLATWLNYTIKASANGVLSPPATYTATTGAAAAEFTNTSTSPSFQVSPYGSHILSTDTSGYCTLAN